jgi:AcrR family transcriptional regulator
VSVLTLACNPRNVVAVSASPPPSRAYADAMATDPEPTKATPRDAFNRAREIVLAGDRLDMLALAHELGIARATLYRWTGDREQLLSDVLWANVHALLEHVVHHTRERGAEGLRIGATRFLTRLAAEDGLIAFLKAEGQTGYRLITDPRGAVRPRLVRAIAAWIEREVNDGFYRPPEQPELLADGIVTLGERFLYHGGYVESNPDADTASRMITLLTREPQSGRSGTPRPRPVDETRNPAAARSGRVAL